MQHSWSGSVRFNTLQYLIPDAVDIFRLAFYFTKQPQQIHRKLKNYTENEKGKFGIRSVSKGTRLTEEKKEQQVPWRHPQTREIIIFYFGQEGICQAVA